MVDFCRLRLLSVDLEVRAAAADGGRRATTDSTGTPPCLATQLAVGANAEPLSSAGFVASLGSGFGTGLCVRIGFGFGAARTGCRGFVGGFDTGLGAGADIGFLGTVEFTGADGVLV